MKKLIPMLQGIHKGYSNRHDCNPLNKLQAKYGVSSCISSKQVHSNRVHVVSKTSMNLDPECDALMTQESHIALTIKTADCLPLTFVSQEGNATIGVVHAGWRGTKENIVQAWMDVFCKRFGGDAKDIRVFLGPAIRSCCYEVGLEFEDMFDKKYIIKKKGSLCFDLVQMNRDQCLESGILEQNIEDLNSCTVCQNDLFYSFRKEGQAAGRMLTWVVKT